MKQITLRSIPDEIEAMVKREAKAKGLSLNKAFITLMERAGGINIKDKKKEDDLSRFGQSVRCMVKK